MKRSSWLIFVTILALAVAVSAGLQACGKSSDPAATTFYGAGS